MTIAAKCWRWTMTECRFFPECARCNEVGDSWFPCEGGADGTRCDGYESMPDVERLLTLADILGSTRETDCRGCRLEGAGCAECSSGVAHEAARRIRDALGVER